MNKWLKKEAEGYKGWANHATWAAAEWLEDDEGLYNELLGVAKTFDDHELAQKLQEYVERNNPLAGQSSMYAEVLSGVLQDVNYGEIAHLYRTYRT